MSKIKPIQSVALFGISDFGIGFLEELIKSKYRISFVTSKHRAVPHIFDLEARLKKTCDKNGLFYLGNADSNSPELIERCKEVDLCIMGGYDKILKKKILRAPKYGFINTHLGIIPQNRGCNPVMWAILKRLEQGATTYAVNEKIDKGDIIDIQKLSHNSLNSHEAYLELSRKVSRNIVSCIEKFEMGTVIKSDGKDCYYTRGMPNDGYVSWNWNNKFIQRFSGAMTFPPYRPMATLINEEPLHLIVERIEFCDSHLHRPGTILFSKDKSISVKTREGIAICKIWDENTNITKGNFCEFKLGNSYPINENFCGEYLK